MSPFRFTTKSNNKDSKTNQIYAAHLPLQVETNTQWWKQALLKVYSLKEKLDM